MDRWMHGRADADRQSPVARELRLLLQVASLVFTGGCRIIFDSREEEEEGKNNK